jgi:hypothetical protein
MLQFLLVLMGANPSLAVQNPSVDEIKHTSLFSIELLSVAAAVFYQHQQMLSIITHNP